MNADELKGRAVVSVLQAHKLGAINDLLIDLKQHQVTGLALQGGLFRGGPVVQWEAVRSVGQDAVMVDDSAAAVAPSEDSTATSTALSSLQGMKVVTDAGDLAGTIDGMDFDPDTGKVTHYFVMPVGGGGLFRSTRRFTVPPPAIAAVGRDLITIDARIIDAQNKMDETEKIT